jgi:integrase/recombinase XerC
VSDQSHILDPFPAFLNYLEKEKRGSVHTLRCYRSDLNQLGRFLAERYEHNALIGISAEWLRSWVVDMMKDGRSPRTIHRKVSAYRAFNRYARRMDFTDQDPSSGISLPKVEKKVPEFVPERNMDELLSGEVFPKSWKGLRDRLMITLLYETGIRLSELIELKAEDVSHARLTIKVHGKGSKDRLIPVSDSCLKWWGNTLKNA